MKFFHMLSTFGYQHTPFGFVFFFYKKRHTCFGRDSRINVLKSPPSINSSKRYMDWSISSVDIPRNRTMFGWLNLLKIDNCKMARMSYKTQKQCSLKFIENHMRAVFYNCKFHYIHVNRKHVHQIYTASFKTDFWIIYTTQEIDFERYEWQYLCSVKL